MLRNDSNVVTAVMMASVYLANPDPSAAQGLQPIPVSSQAPALRMPTVMVSVGFGSANDPRGAEETNLKPMQTFSVQFLPTRHFVMEAEFGRWETAWDRRLPNSIYFPGGQAVSGERVLSGAIEAWSAGMNLLYRTEPRRVSAFVGGGSFFGSERYAYHDRVEGCVPQTAIRDWCGLSSDGEDQDTAWKFQAVTGADVQVAGPVRAYRLGTVHHNGPCVPSLVRRRPRRRCQSLRCAEGRKAWAGCAEQRALE